MTHYKTFVSSLQNTHKEGTIRAIKSFLNKLSDFDSHTHILSKIAVRDFDKEIFKQFSDFLFQSFPYNQNTTWNWAKNIKSFWTWCEDHQQQIPTNRFKFDENKYQETLRIHLSTAEPNAIKSVELPSNF